MSKIRKRKKTLGQKIEPLFWLAPAFLFLGLFSYYPFLKTFFDSFFVVNSMGVIRKFAGLQNYIKILNNAKFLQAIGNTLKFVVFTVPFSVGLSFILAMMANKKRRLSSVYETLFSLPMAMSMSVSAMIFELMFSPTLGIVNAISGSRIQWLNDKNTAMTVVIVIQVWMNLGYNFLFILSAIRGLPVDIFEAAELDGVTPLAKGIKIVMPMVSPTLFFLMCNSLAKMLMMSGLSLILTNGGPSGTTETMISFMYKQTVENANYNAAYASAVIAFFITLVATAITFIYEKKGVNYDV